MRKDDQKIVIYRAVDGGVMLDVQLENETVWLRQEQIALLFGTQRPAITKHLRNIFRDGEVEEKSNVQKMHIPNSELDRRSVVAKNATTYAGAVL